MRLVRFFLGAFLFCGSVFPAYAQNLPDLTKDEFFTAEVIAVEDERTEEGPDGPSTVQTLRFATEEETFVLENGVPAGRDDLRLEEGETVVVERLTKSDGTVEYLLRERYRLPRMLLLLALFALAAVLLGGRTGFASITGLAVSIGILALVVIPRIAAGANPLFTCFLGAVAIACTSIYLAHGFRRRTSVALLSTLVTLCASAVMAVLSVRLGKLFGLGTEEAMFLQSGQFQNIDLRGLLLGGIVIGCLGVLDDITTAQTAAVDEIRRADPSMPKHRLRLAGLSVGKEHIASLINTLALAYIGTSLPLLLLLYSQSNQAFPLWVTLNGEFLAEEIIRTVVGSMTLLVAVPVSTWFASVLLTKDGSPGPQDRRHRHSH